MSVDSETFNQFASPRLDEDLIDLPTSHGQPDWQRMRIRFALFTFFVVFGCYLVAEAFWLQFVESPTREATSIVWGMHGAAILCWLGAFLLGVSYLDLDSKTVNRGWGKVGKLAVIVALLGAVLPAAFSLLFFAAQMQG